MASIQLMGGEKDGHVQRLTVAGVPELFYAVPNSDDPELRVLKGKQLTERTKELAVLAYKLRAGKPKSTETGEMQYLYDRYPEADILHKEA